MPGGNGTGPNGMGPMTGRGAGFCTGNAVPDRGQGLGRGFRLRQGYGGQVGMGARGGWRRGGGYGMPYDAGPTSEQEVGSLEAQVQHLSGVLETINRRIRELKPDNKSE